MASFLTNNIIKLDSITSTNLYSYDLLKRGNLKVNLSVVDKMESLLLIKQIILI